MLGGIVGALLIRIIDNGLVLSQVDANWFQFAIGFLTIFAVVGNSWLRRTRAQAPIKMEDCEQRWPTRSDHRVSRSAQMVFRRPRPEGREPRRSPGRVDRPGRRQRRRQVDADQDPLRRAPAGPGRDPDRRHADGRIRTPKHAMRLGIETIYQYNAMVPMMSIARNVFIGREPTQVSALRLRHARPEAHARGKRAARSPTSSCICARPTRWSASSPAASARASRSPAPCTSSRRCWSSTSRPTTSPSRRRTRCSASSAACKAQNVTGIFISHNMPARLPFLRPHRRHGARRDRLRQAGRRDLGRRSPGPSVSGGDEGPCQSVVLLTGGARDARPGAGGDAGAGGRALVSARPAR